MARKVISDAEIAAAALGAGFKGAAATKIVAIALAESSGNIYAHNAVPPDNSYGRFFSKPSRPVALRSFIAIGSYLARSM